MATLAALRAVPETSVPDGFRAYCAKDGQWYEYNSANEVDATTGKWRRITTEVAQTTGDRADIPMCQQAVTDAVDSLNSKVSGIVDGDDSRDKFFITDESGNIIAEISASGIKTTDVMLLMDGEIVSLIKKLKSGDSTFSDEDKKRLLAIAENIVPASDDDRLRIADSRGNVIAEIDSSGISATDVRVIVGGRMVSVSEMMNGDDTGLSDDAKEKLLEISKNVAPSLDSDFNICDGNGNVAFHVDREGNVKYNDVKSWMHGKVMMSLCDSLGTAGVWQEKIAELTGMKFDKALNYDGDPDTAFSVGGSQTPSHPNGGFDRAKRLVEYVRNGGKVDVVFIENINDSTWVDVNKTTADIDEEIRTLPPHCESEYLYVETTASTLPEAVAEFNNNLSKYIGDVAPSPGMAVYVGYTSVGRLLTITHAPTADGAFSLTVGGTCYDVSVKATDTIADIIKKIVEIDFSNPKYADNKKSDTSVEFVPASGAPEVVFSANGTGIEATIAETSTKNYSGRAYNSFSTKSEDWLDKANWVDKWSFKLSQQIKGLLEYLCANLPDVQFYWFIPTRFGGTIPAGKKADGSIDFDAYKRENIRYELCAYTQRKVCEYYSIPVIDLHTEGGVNIFNQLAYYQLNGGVHPPYSTYEYWGEKAISKLV